jgi:signal peptidase I
VNLEHKAALVVGSFAAPGFAQAVAGRQRAALIWFGLELAFTLLATVWIGFPLLAILLRFVAAVAAFVELRRLDAKLRRLAAPLAWWHRISLVVLIGGIAAFAALRATVEGFKIPSSSMYPALIIGDHIFVDKLSPHWRAPERGEVIVFHFPCAPNRDYVKRVIAVAGDTVEVRCNVVYVNGKAIPNELVEARSTYKDYDEQNQTWFSRETSRYREHHGGHTYEVFHDPGRPERDKNVSSLDAGDNRDFPQRDRMFPPSCQQSDFYERTERAQQPIGKLVVTKQDAQPCEQQAHFVVPAGGLFVMGDNRNNANDSRYWGAASVDSVIGRAIGIWLTNPPSGDASLGRFGGVD